VTSSTLKKNNVVVCGGIYSISEHESIRWNLGYSSRSPHRLIEELKNKVPIHQVAIFYMPKEWLQHISSSERHPYIKLYLSRFEVPEYTTMVVRILRHKFGKPVRGGVITFQANKEGEYIKIKHKVATEFEVISKTVGQVLKVGKETRDVEIMRQKRRKIWW